MMKIHLTMHSYMTHCETADENTSIFLSGIIEQKVTTGQNGVFCQN